MQYLSRLIKSCDGQLKGSTSTCRVEQMLRVQWCSARQEIGSRCPGVRRAKLYLFWVGILAKHICKPRMRAFSVASPVISDLPGLVSPINFETIIIYPWPIGLHKTQKLCDGTMLNYNKGKTILMVRRGDTQCVAYFFIAVTPDNERG